MHQPISDPVQLMAVASLKSLSPTTASKFKSKVEACVEEENEFAVHIYRAVCLQTKCFNKFSIRAKISEQLLPVAKRERESLSG